MTERIVDLITCRLDTRIAEPMQRITRVDFGFAEIAPGGGRALPVAPLTSPGSQLPARILSDCLQTRGLHLGLCHPEPFPLQSASHVARFLLRHLSAVLARHSLRGDELK